VEPAQTEFVDISSSLAELKRLKHKFAFILVHFSLEAHSGVSIPGKSTVPFYHLTCETFLILQYLNIEKHVTFLTLSIS